MVVVVVGPGRIRQRAQIHLNKHQAGDNENQMSDLPGDAQTSRWGGSSKKKA